MGYFVGCFGIFLIFLNIWDIMGYCGNFGWYFGKTANVSVKSYKHEQVIWLDESWVETDIESQILCISYFFLEYYYGIEVNSSKMIDTDTIQLTEAWEAHRKIQACQNRYHKSSFVTFI